LSIVGGAKNRNKTIHIAGEAAALMARLTAVVDALQPR
jgi:hypothetical protein